METTASVGKGVGPTQARNLLQSLGLTWYEIPLDSRVVRWLRDRLGWNISMKSLIRPEYYEDLLDRVRYDGECGDRSGMDLYFDSAGSESNAFSLGVMAVTEKDSYRAECWGQFPRRGCGVSSP